jgi:hypothetical protein
MTGSDSLAAAYVQTGTPLDQLPYTPALDALCERAQRLGATVESPRQVWRDLLHLRKRGLLPRVGRTSRR